MEPVLLRLDASAVSQFLATVRAGTRFLVTCHRNPDADALGSALGFAAVLRSLGKEALVYCPDELPYNLAFLAEGRELWTQCPPGAFDATFVCDAAAEALWPLGLPSRDRGGPRVVLDHHQIHDGAGDLVLRDAVACATAEVAIALMRALGVTSVPSAAATPFYAALVADTGSFRYATTTPHTLRLGAELLEAGAAPWTVAQQLFEGWPSARMSLLQRVLETLRLHDGGRVATLEVTSAMLRETGALVSMADGFVTYARRVAGVEVAALFTELACEDGVLRTKVSLRSRAQVDVAALALRLGGGGHRLAAGARVDASIDETLRLTVQFASEALAKGRAKESEASARG